MERNTVIGFVLLALLFFGYFYYTRQGQVVLEQQKQHTQDSLDRIQHKKDSLAALTNPAKKDSVIKPNISGFNDSVKTEQLTVLENDVLRITFTNKGAQPKIVELKKFRTFDGKPMILQNGTFNKISYPVNSGTNQTVQTSDLFFTGQPITSENGKQTITYQLQNAGGQVIQHQYVLSQDDYMLDFNISFNGADKLVTQNKINLTWQAQASQAEKDISHERLQSHIDHVVDGDYDFENLGSGTNDKKFDKPVDWLTLKQQFFATAILAKNKFESAGIQWVVPADTSTHIIAQAIADCRINIPQGSIANVPLQLFYGPSDYKILKSYGNQMQNIVPLGSGMFAFVKYINRGFIMPVFNFMSSKIASFGLAIALLTIIIRLLISPLTYQSYVSGAKMKLLKPEIDLLKAKYPDDKQTFGMEQMKLFKSVGVNPLGGCIPALLQIPIFFALFNFFNSNISLRGQGFLWAKDLSAYDSVYNLPFSIPLYGAHISLFTIFAVVTSLLISLYGMANMQDQSNPVMKYMPFIFPVILLGVFNNQPSALTWYYTVSNSITLIIQFVIQKYIINHEKILAQMEANKKKPAVKSKWQEKIDAMQASNKKLQTMQQKNTKGKK